MLLRWFVKHGVEVFFLQELTSSRLFITSRTTGCLPVFNSQDLFADLSSAVVTISAKLDSRSLAGTICGFTQIWQPRSMPQTLFRSCESETRKDLQGLLIGWLPGIPVLPARELQRKGRTPEKSFSLSLRVATTWGWRLGVWFDQVGCHYHIAFSQVEDDWQVSIPLQTGENSEKIISWLFCLSHWVSVGAEGWRSTSWHCVSWSSFPLQVRLRDWAMFPSSQSLREKLERTYSFSSKVFLVTKNCPSKNHKKS